ncbi:TetR/AcrR family transcriptional regulator [Gordonia sp. DT218]|uniref:TetR/AcrR family transcriptional regulator n=1 Tax=unclassified Gordonia (in: high G+C Gram-positive bacteria) TaxID=2657482 RepID=UPI003CF76F91
MTIAHSDRDLVRLRVLDAAAELLADGGPDAVTTRAVASSAGVQAPTIYRLFGDKVGLLDAVADRVFADYVDAKKVDRDSDPVRDLRRSFIAHIDFGTSNPGLTAIFSDPLRRPSATEERGIAVLRERIHRVARAGRLRVPEERAVMLVHAIGTGVVLALIAAPKPDRDDHLADAAWESLAAAVLTDVTDRSDDGTRAAALRLRADDDALAAALSPAERTLMREWLDRIAGS